MTEKYNYPSIEDVIGQTPMVALPRGRSSRGPVAEASVPSVEAMVRLLRRAADVIPADRLWVNPDCGLKTRGWVETEAALRNMVAAAAVLRPAGRWPSIPCACGQITTAPLHDAGCTRRSATRSPRAFSTASPRSIE